MAVLVIADHDNGSLKDNTHKTVTAALGLSSDIDVLVAGKGAKAVADAAAKITGVRKVLLAESDELGVDTKPRLKVLKVTEPPKRAGGIKVETAADLVSKLKTEAGVI